MTDNKDEFELSKVRLGDATQATIEAMCKFYVTERRILSELAETKARSDSE